MKIGISEQTVCEVVTSPVHERVIGTDTVSDGYYKQKTNKSTLQPGLTRHAKMGTTESVLSPQKFETIYDTWWTKRLPL